MLLLNQIRMFSDGYGGYPMWDDGMGTGKLSLVIILAVFGLQLTFAGLALLLRSL